MRTATALLVGALIMTVAMPALASEQTLTIVQDDGTPRISQVDGDTSGEIRTSIVGHYLWVTYGDLDEETASDADNNVSVNVSDPTITQAVVSTDGTVTLIRESSDEPNEQTREQETINLITKLPEFEVF